MGIRSEPCAGTTQERGLGHPLAEELSGPVVLDAERHRIEDHVHASPLVDEEVDDHVPTGEAVAVDHEARGDGRKELHLEVRALRCAG
jgi:hypothetical protein